MSREIFRLVRDITFLYYSRLRQNFDHFIHSLWATIGENIKVRRLVYHKKEEKYRQYVTRDYHVQNRLTSKVKVVT